MKKPLATLLFLLFIPLALHAQSDKITGVWLTGEGSSQVEIFKGSDGKFHGKIVWLEEPYEDGKPKKDKENPDRKLRERPLLGLNLLKGFSYNRGKKQWTGGTIYDPDNGKTYDCYAWFENGDSNTLFLKGYVMGMKWLGRSTTWTRDSKR